MHLTYLYIFEKYWFSTEIFIAMQPVKFVGKFIQKMQCVHFAGFVQNSILLLLQQQHLTSMYELTVYLESYTLHKYIIY